MERGLDHLRRKRIKQKKKKRIRFIILICIVVILLCNGISSLISGGKVTITIPKGTSSVEIADILKDNDIIESKFMFLARLKTSRYNGKLQYGEFTFDKNDSYGKIIKALATEGAKRSTVTLTIPEGFSVERIKARVVELGICTDAEFEAALRKNYDYAFLASVPAGANVRYRIQGFLYPSTYEFYSDSEPETIIKTMLDEFEKQTAHLNIEDYYKTITLASMVEREAKLDSERATISGVFYNRLKNDMKMEIDATAVYALTDGMYDMDRVFFKDLTIDSPYNTYLYKGLPVGPICSPGIKSIEAALTPETHDYLYYHTDNVKNDGSHIFTKTLEEHEATMN